MPHGHTQGIIQTQTLITKGRQETKKGKIIDDSERQKYKKFLRQEDIHDKGYT
jgi:hypothetical protein